METAIKKAFKSTEQPQVIRYADDFVVFHPTLEGVQRARETIETWLHDIGLELKPSKTSISHTLTPYQDKVGFTFLGFAIRQIPVGKTHTGKTPDQSHVRRRRCQAVRVPGRGLHHCVDFPDYRLQHHAADDRLALRTERARRRPRGRRDLLFRLETGAGALPEGPGSHRLVKPRAPRAYYFSFLFVRA